MGQNLIPADAQAIELLISEDAKASELEASMHKRQQQDAAPAGLSVIAAFAEAPAASTEASKNNVQTDLAAPPAPTEHHQLSTAPALHAAAASAPSKAGSGFSKPDTGPSKHCKAHEQPPVAQQKHKGKEKGTGRNQPCPCGSHKKFKQCCGAARKTGAGVCDPLASTDLRADPLYV